MSGNRTPGWAAMVAVSALAVAACGGGGESATTATSPTSAGAPSSTQAPPPDGLVTSISDAKSAIVQVLAAGSFRDPVEGTSGFHGSGSGFIIDPSGIVVTNNHVVTGAGAIEVLIGGSDQEVPAKVLGVSECSDIAVLQLTDPGPYPYVEWFDGDIQPPLEVYAAGFPLGDPEYTVTRGVVSKAEADGESSWASVRNVIEHDANIQPGNSGGPLLTSDAQVVGVNYAGGDIGGTGTSQFFAISPALARSLVDELTRGNTETIGVNGQAILSDDGSLAGVWVAAVAAGSSAARAGVLAGDIITTLNGVQMTPGTMEGYCDVLRTANDGDAIAIEVIRSDTEEVWAGELNGTPMSARFSFAEELGGEVDDTGASYTYETIVDDTNTISVSVPAEWVDRTTSATALDDGTRAPSIQAAPSIAEYTDTFTTPGMVFVYLAGLGGQNDAVIDSLLEGGSCTEDAREDYDDPVFVGRISYSSCPDGALLVNVVGSPKTNPADLVVVNVQVITEADLEALDQILYTFNLNI